MPCSAQNGIGSSRALITIALAGAFASAAWAQDAVETAWAAEPDAVTTQPQQVARLEVTTTGIVRPGIAESAYSGPRVDMSLLPPRRSAVGLALGMNGFAAPAATIGAGLVPVLPRSVDVGVHWRHTLDSNFRFDVRAWRRVPSQMETLADQSQATTYGAQVEFPLSPQRAGKRDFATDKGILGFQLENGGRISIRRKHGGPMLYYRVKF